MKKTQTAGKHEQQQQQQAGSEEVEAEQELPENPRGAEAKNNNGRLIWASKYSIYRAYSERDQISIYSFCISDEKSMSNSSLTISGNKISRIDIPNWNKRE